MFKVMELWNYLSEIIGPLFAELSLRIRTPIFPQLSRDQSRSVKGERYE